MQISAAGLGAAVVPSIAGVLARAFTLEIIPVYLLVMIALLYTAYSLAMRYVSSKV
jgi:fucose permease